MNQLDHFLTGFLKAAENHKKKHNNWILPTIGAGLGVAGLYTAYKTRLLPKLVGRVATNIKGPYGYDLRQPKQELTQHPLDSIKAIINDGRNPKNPVTQEVLDLKDPDEITMVRDTLTRAGFGLKPRNDILQPTGTNTWKLNINNEYGKKFQERMTNDIKDSLKNLDKPAKSINEVPDYFSFNSTLGGTPVYKSIDNSGHPYYKVLKDWTYNSAHTRPTQAEISGTTLDPNAGMVYRTDPLIKNIARFVDLINTPQKLEMDIPAN